ncbi:MAG: hypothetical protein V4436_02495 [Patescibacteria group bacterium]
MAETNAEKLKSLEDRLGEAETLIEGLKNEITSTRQQMEEARNFVNENLPTAQASINDIRAHRESSVAAANEIQSLTSQSKEKLEELKESLDEILGDEGLKNRAQAAIAEIEEQREAQKNEYDALLEKVNALLPGAASVGLAQAYRDRKDSYTWSSLFWPAIFIIAIGAVVVIGIVSFSEVTGAHTLEEAYVKVIARLPYYIAAIWLAAFASKRQSQNKRLQEEYAHKESLALSLEGYKRQVQEMEDDSLMNKLMDSAVAMVAFNPSTTLDGKHGDDSHPLYGFFNAFRSKGSESKEE